MFKFLNTKKQGDYGVGVAICYFTQAGYHVSVPLTDSQDYDLIVDVDGELNRVQVKTTSYKTKTGNFQANLSTKGGNRSRNTITKFDSSKVEIVFIVTSDNTCYSIPSKELTIGSNITLSDKYSKYIVGV